MDPAALKQKYGDRITFWGGGIDSAERAAFRHARRDPRNGAGPDARFRRGGGFVFNTVHNVQAGVPVDLLALYQAINEFRDYPLG